MLSPKARKLLRYRYFVYVAVIAYLAAGYFQSTQSSPSPKPEPSSGEVKTRLIKGPDGQVMEVNYVDLKGGQDAAQVFQQFQLAQQAASAKSADSPASAQNTPKTEK